MKAWRFYDFGKMQLDEVSEPKAKEGWVVVKVKVVQPSITETMLAKGIPTNHYDLVKEKLAEAPAQLFGHEFSAEIIEIGLGVKDFAVGDRVTSKGVSACGDCYLCRSGNEDQCQKGSIVGFHIPGCFAEYAALPMSTLVKLPDNVSDCQGANIQPLTGAVAAVKAAQIEMGDVVVVMGMGSMGLSCMQTSRVSGAGIVIAVDVNRNTLELAQKLGADIVVDGTQQDPVESVLEFTNGKGADVVFEAAGGPPEQGLSGTKTFVQATKMVKDSGKIIGVALYGDHTKLSYEIFRGRGKQYLFPAVRSKNLLKHAVNLVASKRVNIEQMITHVLEGIDKVPKAFELTGEKTKYNLLSPAQVVILQ